MVPIKNDFKLSNSPRNGKKNHREMAAFSDIVGFVAVSNSFILFIPKTLSIPKENIGTLLCKLIHQEVLKNDRITPLLTKIINVIQLTWTIEMVCQYNVSMSNRLIQGHCSFYSGIGYSLSIFYFI